MQIGCNYWASHAGTEMWRNWSEETVEKDFAQMEEAGFDLVRVFPNWRDFQPVELICTYGGTPQSYEFKGKALPPCGEGSDGVDPVMLARFRRLCEIADAHHVNLLVSILTGWMSGRLFFPPALAGKNLITDPLAHQFEVRFVRRFVRELKDCKAIRLWDLGNECNCMGKVSTPAEAWQWTCLISSAIRLEDNSRPVASGMHGLAPGEEPGKGGVPPWSIQMQGEFCDLMTGHPYPNSVSKPAARLDTHSSIRTAFQAAAEMLYYADIAGKPGAVEEIGTYGPSYCAEKEKCSFMHNALFNCWAHGAEHFLWWCAYDHAPLDYPPYQWGPSRELGLFTADRQVKPSTGVLRQFSAFLKSQPLQKLPPFRRDAVCLLTRGLKPDESQTAAWSSMVLAKENHFDIQFAFCSGKLPESRLYLVPCVSSIESLYKPEFDALAAKAAAGATVLYTMNNGAFQPFEERFGVEAESREARTAPAEVSFNGETFLIPSVSKLILRTVGAEVLATEKDGNPVFVRFRYGKGWNYLLTLPLELLLGSRPGVFNHPGEPAWRNFYRDCAAEVVAARTVHTAEPLLTLTEHPVDEKLMYAVAVNNGDVPFPAKFDLAYGWKITSAMPELIPAHDGIVIKLEK